MRRATSRPAPSQPAIALIQRGTCTFQDKVENATAAGYDAVIIFNEGQPGRDRTVRSARSALPQTIPVVGLSYADGVALYDSHPGRPVTVAGRHLDREST